jgi:hypothetical protein
MSIEAAHETDLDETAAKGDLGVEDLPNNPVLFL